MIILFYVAWIGPAYWPIAPIVVWLILAELLAENVILWAIGLRGLIRVWRRS